MKKAILFLIVAVLLCGAVSAYPVSNLNTGMILDQDGTAKVRIHIIFDSTSGMEYISLPAYNPTAIKVTNGKNELEYATIGNSILIRPAEKKKDYEIQVDYTTESLTSKEKDRWGIEYTITSAELMNYDGLENTVIIIVFPEDSMLESHTKEDTMLTENNRLKASWKLNVNKNQDVKIEALYTTNTLIKENREKIANIITIVLLLVLALVVLCISGNYIVNRYLKRISKGKKDIIKTLTEHEAEVVKLLLKNKNQMYQSKIHKETGISKATLSRIVKRLESKNIVKTTSMGNTNRVALTKWFIKK